MNDNFGYIDIVLLAIVAGIIILRLRNVLGKGAEDGQKYDFLYNLNIFFYIKYHLIRSKFRCINF